jgi:hypothetical protein
MDEIVAELKRVLTTPEFATPDCRTKAERKSHISFIRGFELALEIAERIRDERKIS